MSMTDPFPLTPQIVRGLNDKLYEKRKAAALEIEKYFFFISLFLIYILYIHLYKYSNKQYLFIICFFYKF